MWDLTGKVIYGTYHGVEYAGVIRSSRVKYGGKIQHTVDLYEPITVFDVERATILVDSDDRYTVDDSELSDA